MKFWDILRISIHNIFNNKLRTLLVTLVLFILSTIIVIVASVGINFAGAINDVWKDTSMSVADLKIEYPMFYDSATGNHSRENFFDKEAVENYKETIKVDYPFLQNMTLSSEFEFLELDNLNSFADIVMFDTSNNILSGTYNYLIDGRLWNKSDAGKTNIWINNSFSENNNIYVGDTINLKVYKEGRYANDPSFTVLKMTVAGIVEYNSSYYYESDSILFDYQYALDNGVKINKIHFTESNIVEGTSISKLNKINSFIKANNEYHYKNNPSGLKVYSDAVEGRNMAMLFTSLIIIAVVVISVIIILLSIGCVSNSIQITVEQNAKFFGMMKAIGMRNSVVKSIVRIQSIIMIFISICLATAVTIGVLYAINPLLATALQSVGFAVTLSMPFYIPIAVFAILTGMVILFTIKSLNRISKMDVVSVISEVN